MRSPAMLFASEVSMATISAICPLPDSTSSGRASFMATAFGFELRRISKGHRICSGCSCTPIWVESQWAGNGLRSQHLLSTGQRTNSNCNYPPEQMLCPLLPSRKTKNRKQDLTPTKLPVLFGSSSRDLSYIASAKNQEMFSCTPKCGSKFNEKAKANPKGTLRFASAGDSCEVFSVKECGCRGSCLIPGCFGAWITCRTF